MAPASLALESFIDETIRLSAKKGYHPTTFIGMRSRYGTLEAMKRLVRNGDVQSGFRRLTQLGLEAWTVEAAIVKFSAEFDQTDIECATWRLNEASKEASR